MSEETLKQEILGAIDGLKQELKQEISGAIDGLKKELKQEVLGAIDGLRQEMTGSIEEVLVVMSEHSTKMDERFDGVDGRLDVLESDMKEVKQQLTQMVPRDYLDKRVSEAKGESIPLVRKEDEKLSATIELLYKKDVLSKEEQNVLLKMEPFPRIIP